MVTVEQHNFPTPRFCSDISLAEPLATWLTEDLDAAQLSRAFRAYYGVRPFLPIPVRQLLQKLRNSHQQQPVDWYLPQRLLQLLESLGAPVPSIWPDQAEFSLVLTHDVETKRGLELVPRLAEIEEELGFGSSWNIVPYKYKTDKGLVRDLTQRGHEFGIHGYNHDGRLFLSKKTFDRRLPFINRAIEEFGAVGFRAPMVHRNLQWMQQLNVDYDSSCFDVDPFQAMPGGVQSFWPFLYGSFVELPYTLPQDHTLLVTLGEKDDAIWRKKLSIIRRYHGMALMLTHPDYLDSPERLKVYRDFLMHLRELNTYWHALPRELASFFRQKTAETT